MWERSTGLQSDNICGSCCRIDGCQIDEIFIISTLYFCCNSVCSREMFRVLMFLGGVALVSHVICCAFHLMAYWRQWSQACTCVSNHWHERCPFALSRSFRGHLLPMFAASINSKLFYFSFDICGFRSWHAPSRLTGQTTRRPKSSGMKPGCSTR